MMKFLALTWYWLARLAMTLTSVFAIIVCFQKVNFQNGISLHFFISHECHSKKIGRFLWN